MNRCPPGGEDSPGGVEDRRNGPGDGGLLPVGGEGYAGVVWLGPTEVYLYVLPAVGMVEARLLSSETGSGSSSRAQ